MKINKITVPAWADTRVQNLDYAYSVSKFDDAEADYYVNELTPQEDLVDALYKYSNDSFRDGELFTENDYITPEYKKYDEDEVVFYKQPKAILDPDYLPPFNFSLDTHIDYINLLKDNKKIVKETFLWDLDKLDPYLLKELFSYGCNYDELANVLYSSRLSDKMGGYTNLTLAKDALNMLSQGYPLEFVLKNIDTAILKGKNGFQVYSKGLLPFLSEYPSARDLVVLKKYDSDCEVFDIVAAHKFKVLYTLYDFSTIKSIFDVSRMKRSDGVSVVNSELCNFAVKLYKANNDCVDNDIKAIMNCLKKYDVANHCQNINYGKFIAATRALAKTSSVKEVLAKLNLN